MSLFNIKERPILFSGEMVRAILDGRKTQTRRIAKLPLDEFCDGDRIDLGFGTNENGEWRVWECEYAGEGSLPVKCPFGNPGDRLWVRETHAFVSSDCGDFVADDYNFHFECADTNLFKIEYAAGGGAVYWYPEKWRPSIHMPRWACRIVLEITNVRVERLNDISEGDAKAEGVDKSSFPDEYESDDKTGYFEPTSYMQGFEQIWHEIYGLESWAKNPWVWVIEFKRVV